MSEQQTIEVKASISTSLLEDSKPEDVIKLLGEDCYRAAMMKLGEANASA